MVFLVSQLVESVAVGWLLLMDNTSPKLKGRWFDSNQGNKNYFMKIMYDSAISKYRVICFDSKIIYYTNKYYIFCWIKRIFIKKIYRNKYYL